MTENNDISSKSVEQEECGEDGIVTMVDVLKAEETLEENAAAVLGPGDDQNCTYNEGYLKRQPLYSCLTCLPAEGKESGAVCLACSYHCHGDHDLVELYTKRNFRCDCGNSLFKGRSCTLKPDKTPVNENNLYNKNFQRLYCICNQPYPGGPDDLDEDTMVQCIVCEDWFHSKHLESLVPHDDDYAEMICGSCTDKLPFLQYYLGYSVSKVLKADDKNESDVNVSVTEENTSLNTSEELINGDCSLTAEKYNHDLSEGKHLAEDKNSSSVKGNDVTATIDDTDVAVSPPTQGSKDTVKKEILRKSSSPNKHASSSPTKQTEPSTSSDKGSNVSVKEQGAFQENRETEETVNYEESMTGGKSVALNTSNSPSKHCGSSPAKQAESCSGSGDNECKLKNLKRLPRGTGATFWPEGFRKLLCSCLSCKEMYENHKVPFLIDESDTITVYEEGKTQKKSSRVTQYQLGMEALSSLDRVQQMEAILNYNELKTQLSEYLAKFVENKKVVREEDIREFFTGMQARKRQKLDIPYHCR